MDERIEKLMYNLKERQFKPFYAEKRQDVVPLVKTLVKPGDTVANGGSQTLKECGVLEFLARGDFNYLTVNEDMTAREKKEIMRKKFFADDFFLSANGVTIDGRIFQEDGASTRVAPMIYGPDNIIIVIGKNKIVDTEGQAKARIKKVAPQNCAKAGFDTPCAVDGRCHDCRVPARSCCTSVTLNYSRIPDRIKVIIVNEDLGI